MTDAPTVNIGDAAVSVLEDGSSTFSPELFPGTGPAHIESLLREAGRAEIDTCFNAVLIRHCGQVVLVDAGAGSAMGEKAGKLPAALATQSVTPDQVGTLFATHMHPDHVAGMITETGEAAFPHAELVMTEAEHAFWSDTSSAAGGPEWMGRWSALADKVLDAYSDRIRLIPPEGEIAPGLTALPLPGHTPGHSGWRLESGGKHLIHVADIVHAPALQIADPRIAVAFDLNPDEARRARRKLLDMLATDGLRFTGGHMLHPSIHRIERKGQGFRLVSPEQPEISG